VDGAVIDCEANGWAAAFATGRSKECSFVSWPDRVTLRKPNYLQQCALLIPITARIP
jgi:hypothetical protein